jgi:hypothetical protein
MEGRNFTTRILTVNPVIVNHTKIRLGKHGFVLFVPIPTRNTTTAAAAAESAKYFCKIF